MQTVALLSITKRFTDIKPYHLYFTLLTIQIFILRIYESVPYINNITPKTELNFTYYLGQNNQLKPI